LPRAGGHGRAQKLTPKERSESARKAVKARWAKADKLIREMKAAEKEALRLVRRRRQPTVTLVKLDNVPILSVQPGHITVHIVRLTNKAEVREFIQALEKAAEDAGLPEKRKGAHRRRVGPRNALAQRPRFADAKELLGKSPAPR
jgi:hypothetical protein